MSRAPAKPVLFILFLMYTLAGTVHTCMYMWEEWWVLVYSIRRYGNSGNSGESYILCDK